jgi:hypothetical protein
MNAAVDQRAPLSFAAAVGQLVRFDLRRFRVVLALFAALEIARAAFAEWFLHRAPLELDGRFGGDGGHGELAVLDVALWLATVIATAVVVQADHPADDRAFWRTRPVAPLALATGKLVLLAGLSVALPTIVNAVRLLAYGAPIASVAASAVQFAVLAGATVLPAWGLAIATRTLRAFLAACAGLVIGLFLAFSAFGYLLATLLDTLGPGRVGVSLDPLLDWQRSSTFGLGGALLVTSLGIAILLAYYRSRHGMLALAAALALAVAPHMLTMRARRLVPASPTLAALVESRLRLATHLRVPTRRALASADPRWSAPIAGPIRTPPLPSDIAVGFDTRDVRLTVDGKSRDARGGQQCCTGTDAHGMVMIATGAMPGPIPTGSNGTLFFLPAEQADTLHGRRVDVDAHVRATFRRHRLVGTIPLRAGAAFRTDEYLLEVLAVQPRPRAVLCRLAQFPPGSTGRRFDLTLLVGDPQRRLDSTFPSWVFDAHRSILDAAGAPWGRRWVARVSIPLRDAAVTQGGASIYIVESRFAGHAETTLRARQVPVSALPGD